MIAKLKGLLDSVAADSIVIDVNGVGYHVHCSPRTLSALPSIGEPVDLAIETNVREDAIQLFGFASATEREWFRLLQSVQGVGARVALAILGTLRVDELALAIAAQDKTAVARTNGVGPKLAARIVNELKDRVASADLKSMDVDGVGAAAADGVTSDAVSALVNLGYRQVDAAGAISAAHKRLGEGATLETLIRDGLKELAH